IRELRAVESKGDGQLTGLARFALAEVYANTGKMAEAEKIFRDLAQNPTEAVSKEMALLGLADRLSVTKPAEAEKVYREVEKLAANRTGGDIASRRLAELSKK